MPNGSTHPTIRGVDAVWFRSRAVSSFQSFQTCWLDNRRPHSLQRCTDNPKGLPGPFSLSGHGGGLGPDVLSRSLLLSGYLQQIASLDGASSCFKKPLAAFVTPTLRPATNGRSAGHVMLSYALPAASYQDDPGAGFGSIPIRLGSQSVPCFSIDQATTAILRANAMAAFFLRVF